MWILQNSFECQQIQRLVLRSESQMTAKGVARPISFVVNLPVLLFSGTSPHMPFSETQDELRTGA